MLLPLAEPHDGWEPIERQFVKLTICNMYRKIKNPTDRFIFMATHESGYTQDEIAHIIGISQAAVGKHLMKIMVRLKILKKQGKF